jgi:hypothetical protein
MSRRDRQRIALGGLLFVVLFVVSSFVVPSTPGSHATAAKVIAFYHKHKTVVAVNAWIIEVAVFVGVFFFWYLREYLSTVPANRRLAALGFAGVILFATDGGLSAGINFTLADSANHLSGTTMQTLNVIQNDLTIFLSGVGAAIFLAATGLVVIRSGVLPRWLGWIGVVFAVAALALPFLGILGVALWTLITCIVLLVAKRGPASTVEEPVAGSSEASSEGSLA